MKVSLSSLVRENIRNMEKYASARDDFSGPARIFLDANENAFGSPSDHTLNRYPDPLQKQLRKRIADYKQLDDPETVFLGNGSDEAIDLLMRAFCVPGTDKLMIMSPTYGMYSVSAHINDVRILDVPLKKDFSLDTERVIETAQKEKPKLIFICSPNNPSGNVYAPEDIEKILNAADSLVMIDEAYIDFSEARSWIERISDFPNLVVI
ncbi:MAG: aminotransferase class I/II-fold pyridoxal phosphate-dependent enzyme, partial [Candidatus Marinimicrobia bacterium]|nr:aminotransferase class I/II-fold pyridoxal phosphate-dependent enzyme [Candidatus Neomarinimicrobiota bacterium]